MTRRPCPGPRSRVLVAPDEEDEVVVLLSAPDSAVRQLGSHSRSRCRESCDYSETVTLARGQAPLEPLRSRRLPGHGCRPTRSRRLHERIYRDSRSRPTRPKMAGLRPELHRDGRCRRCPRASRGHHGLRDASESSSSEKAGSDRWLSMLATRQKPEDELFLRISRLILRLPSLADGAFSSI